MSPSSSASATASQAERSAWRGLPMRLVRALCSNSSSGGVRLGEAWASAVKSKLEAAQLDFARTEAQQHVVATALQVGQRKLAGGLHFGPCGSRGRAVQRARKISRQGFDDAAA